MTNEELVSLIQKGDTSKMLDLWEQNQGLIRLKAQRVMTFLDASGQKEIEFDDLIQSAYLGLERAVHSYNSERGFAFGTYLGKVLNSVLWRSSAYYKTTPDALDYAISLQTPIGDDPDSGTLEDIVVDSTDEINHVLDDMERQRIHQIIEDVLSGLCKSKADVIKLHFFYELSNDEISVQTGIPVCLVKQWLAVPALRRELKGLRAEKYKAEIEKYLDMRTNFYETGNVEKQSSPVEELVVWREEQRSRLTNNISPG